MREMWFKMGIKSGRASLKEKKKRKPFVFVGTLQRLPLQQYLDYRSGLGPRAIPSILVKGQRRDAGPHISQITGVCLLAQEILLAAMAVQNVDFNSIYRQFVIS